MQLLWSNFCCKENNLKNGCKSIWTTRYWCDAAWQACAHAGYQSIRFSYYDMQNVVIVFNVCLPLFETDYFYLIEQCYISCFIFCANIRPCIYIPYQFCTWYYSKFLVFHFAALLMKLEFFIMESKIILVSNCSLYI